MRVESLRKLHAALVWRSYHRWPLVASALRRRWLLLRHPHVEFRFDGPVYFGPGFSLHAPDPCTFAVGAGVEFRRGFRCELAHGARFSVGAGTVFTNTVLVQCSTSIDIGARCAFGQATMLVDGNHRFRDLDRPLLAQGYDFRPLHIGDDVMVSTKCTVIADLGERAFLGANSVVVRPIPAYCLAAGVPAKVRDYFGPPGKEPEELVGA
jgi:acetyltransferase-like isoleucine patch superfamily enzyme